jgi:hypothetical protein
VRKAKKEESENEEEDKKKFWRKGRLKSRRKT